MLAGLPCPVYVGSAALPRHVLLVLAAGRGPADPLVAHDPATGRPRRLEVPELRLRAARHRVAGAVVHGRAAACASAISAAYSGLITRSMISSRSSNGRNADFMALMVNQRRSSSP